MKRKVIIKCLLTNCLAAFAATFLVAYFMTPETIRAHGSEEALKAFMEPYGKIGTALAADDLAAAQTAAKTLTLDKDAQAIAASKDLNDARLAFKRLSKKAISMAGDDAGYYVFKCPMVDDGYWVQTSAKTANPYLGKSMLGCGKVLGKEEAMKVAPKTEMPGMQH